MIVICNHEKIIRDAYAAGAVDMLLHLKESGPKPDAEKYLLKKSGTRRAAVPRFSGE